MGRKKKHKIHKEKPADTVRDKSTDRKSSPAAKRKLPIKQVTLYVVLAVAGIFAVFKLMKNWGGE